jgi:hypothetical protein
MHRSSLILPFGALVGALAASQASAQGCDHAGVAGPWYGRATVRLVATPAPIPVTFADDFVVADATLSGRMQFLSVGPVELPAWVSKALSESYVVTFGDGEDISFTSNWGGGDGYWGSASYAMTFRDLTSTARVDERGEIVDCDHMIVDADFYELGAKLGVMHALYTRPGSP